MTQANPLWGAPRIHGELLKLGIDISERSVSRLMPKVRKPPSQTWRTFLNNHIRASYSEIEIRFKAKSSVGEWRE